jgi:hypothetical protein
MTITNADYDVIAQALNSAGKTPGEAYELLEASNFQLHIKSVDQIFRKIHAVSVLSRMHKLVEQKNDKDIPSF